MARVIIALLLTVVVFGSPTALAAPPGATCGFVGGFATLHDLAPDVVGDCKEDEHHDATSGDALQATTNGLLVWRKADNWTAFTDGSTTWINGPEGLQSRPNDQRFAWENAATTYEQLKAFPGQVLIPAPGGSFANFKVADIMLQPQQGEDQPFYTIDYVLTDDQNSPEGALHRASLHGAKDRPENRSPDNSMYVGDDCGLWVVYCQVALTNPGVTDTEVFTNLSVGHDDGATVTHTSWEGETWTVYWYDAPSAMDYSMSFFNPVDGPYGEGLDAGHVEGAKALTDMAATLVPLSQ
jgi:hypothetical protein